MTIPELAEIMIEAQKSGTPAEAVSARLRWQAAANARCADCQDSGPLHPWLGDEELICAQCDHDRRLTLSEYFSAQDRQHFESMHGPEVAR